MIQLREPWLVAAWPGMGAVALLAADYLRLRLGAEQLVEVPAGEHFQPGGVEVKEGILLPPRAPRTLLSAWRNPGSGRDLVILLGEQQPTSASWRYCQAVLDSARELGAVRAYTFAAMAMPSSPKAPARVFAAATEAATLGEVRRLGAEPIRAGEIGGLNGVFLAAASERRLPGACLLGEIPFYASTVSNPKAAAAVLRVFARLAGVDLDLGELERAGAEVERQLAALHEKLEEAARKIQEAAAQKASEAGPEPPGEWTPPPGAEALSPRDAARIEALFAEAQRDRAKALQLKAELDRLRVFERYEDRFLDLFKRAELV
jgi:proteasome assembly chaperone (PAC2) family protein